MKMTRFNDYVYYSDLSFDFGFNENRIPEIPIYAARANEAVFQTVRPFNGMAVDRVEKILDVVDFAIIEEIGSRKYLSSLQVYQYVRLRGLSVRRKGIRNRLNKMMKMRLIREYEIILPDQEKGVRAYDLDYKGFQLALRRGVVFHKGNRYISERRKHESGEFDTAESIKRILVGNMIILGLIMNGAAIKRFGIMETMRPLQDELIKDGYIIRTAANIQIDEYSHLLYDVVRSTPHSMRRVADKVERYYRIANDLRYLRGNYYGYSVFPQLVICGENYKHCIKIDQYLRSKGLYSEKNTLLYTDDLLYIQKTLQNVYELDQEGNRIWYSLPKRQDEMMKSA